MRKLGIIGGAGPLASALFYQMVVSESYRQKGPIPHLFLLNFPFTRGLTLTESKQQGQNLQKELEGAIRTLEHNGSEYGVVVCNTLHHYLSLLPKRLMSFFSLPQLVLDSALKNKHHKLLILGTQVTCKEQVYAHPSITALYPRSEEQLLIDRVIDHVLEGRILEEDAFLLSQIVFSIAGRVPFDGVVLGCTDLPVLHYHHPIRSPVSLYDSIKIPAERIYTVLRGGR